MPKNIESQVKNNSVEIYLPTSDRSGGAIPGAVRSNAFKEICKKFTEWFGGATAHENPVLNVQQVTGLWGSDSGGIAKEPVTVIQSFANDQEIEDHFDEIKEFVAQLANELDQESMACRINRDFHILRSTAPKIRGKNSKQSAKKEDQTKSNLHLISLQASLQRLSSKKELKDLFFSKLGYEVETQSFLTTNGWPKGLEGLLAPGTLPEIIAEQNGFRVIHVQLNDQQLRKSAERRIVQQLLKAEGSRGLVVVSTLDDKSWDFINVKTSAQQKTSQNLVLRRLRVGEGRGIRTAIEQLDKIRWDKIPPEATAADIQKIHEEAFDVEAVTKAFYKDIANWYFWALQHSKFPKDAPKEADGRDHISLIRLITRLIFCWFLREKGLIPKELFDQEKLQNDILKGFSPDSSSNTESVYYRAILQNLFFATLSTEITERHWAQNNSNFMAHSLYRFEYCFQKPQEALAIFRQVPFLNGGLFECLDKDLGEGKSPRYLRVDGFSRRADSQATLPDFLFFGPDTVADLSNDYGDKEFSKVRVCGLIHILSRYNFTVEENTPIEEEVALDPELSGKVFENLLAAYNPETKTTARKQSGSFYTRREIVNYMVDEALIAYFCSKLEAAIPTAKDIKARLHHLFAYNDESNPFNPEETKALIAAIDDLKSLDPAVGSGAFPMGLLHKLVFILGKLDPRNEQWKDRQIARVREAIAAAEKIDDDSIRSRTLEELEQQIVNVNEAFNRNELDYGRKLYLIENCIYGVDIQPIAVQIAKMRFFISLIVDQKIDDSLHNRGIRPLPNLETKFVAANSLIGIDKTGQQMLRNEKVATQVQTKETELRRVRERHFLARTPRSKAKCREEDARLRLEISELLKGDGWDSTTAARLAMWNPYNQNESAPFYDSEWMFGIIKGFDIVIGNPPFGANIDALLITLRLRYQKVIQNYADSFKMFFQVGIELTAPNGILAYISPNVFLSQPRYKDLRQYLLRYRIEKLVNLGEDVFPQVVVPVCLSFISNARVAPEYQFADLTAGNKFSGDFSDITYQHVSISQTLSSKDMSLYDFVSLKAGQVSFGDALEIKDAGIQYHRSGIGLKNKGGNDLYDRLFSSSSSYFSKSRPVWYGRLIDRYWIQEQTDEFFNLAYKEILKENESASFTLSAFSTVPKILWRQTASCLRASIDHHARWFRNTIQCAFLKPAYADKLDIYYVLGIVNSRFISYTYNRLVKEAGRVFPQVKITHVKKLPLAVSSKAEQLKTAALVHKILREKQANPAADTTALEREIDQQVYALYGLTPEEIAIVEEATA